MSRQPTPTPTPPTPGLALVGYRGTGKTTVGRLLAGRLGWPFLDADAELEPRLGAPIARVFAERGEPAFRDAEQRLLEELAGRPAIVLATGGGCVLREANRRALRRLGFVAWLTADPSTLAERLRRDPGGRPALTERGLTGEVVEVLAARTPLYREVAHEAVATAGRPPEAVAEEVLRLFDRWRAAVAAEAAP